MRIAIWNFSKRGFYAMLCSAGMTCALTPIIYGVGLAKSSAGYAEAQTYFHSLPVWKLALLTLIIAPIIEELIFRGLLYGVPKYILKIFKIPPKLLFITTLAVTSSTLFAIHHGNIVQGIYAFFMGLAMCFVYECCGGIIWTICFHFFANCFSIIVGGALYSESLTVRITLVISGLNITIYSIYKMYQLYKEKITGQPI